MDARKIQEIFNSTVIKDIEIEILSTQHEVDKRHFNYEAGEEVIKCLLSTRKSLLAITGFEEEEGGESQVVFGRRKGKRTGSPLPRGSRKKQPADTLILVHFETIKCILLLPAIKFVEVC